MKWRKKGQGGIHRDVHGIFSRVPHGGAPRISHFLTSRARLGMAGRGNYQIIKLSKLSNYQNYQIIRNIKNIKIGKSEIGGKERAGRESAGTSTGFPVGPHMPADPTDSGIFTFWGLSPPGITK